MTGILRSKIERLKTIGEQLMSQGLKRIDRYDVVSEHSISAVFRETLVKARKIDKPFGMLMLWQDFTKARKLIWSASGVMLRPLPDPKPPKTRRARHAIIF